MKKLIHRFLGVVVAAALLMGSVMPNVAVMAAGGHSHGGDTPLNKGSETIKDSNFTITLKHPVKDNQFTTAKSHYGAYQIFSGTVKGTSEEEPGKRDTGLPITDIKWGSAFGNSGDIDTKKNILAFVYALSTAPTGEYKYAFSDFEGFEGFFNVATSELSKDYITTGSVTATLTSASGNIDNVKFDKLAVAVADVLAKNINDHEWLQAFNDILGGYANGGTSGYKNKAYAKCYYEGYVGSDEKEDSPSDVYTIYVPAGYYMIRDMSEIDDTSADDRDESYSARMLFVTNNITQTLKEAVPELDKEILREETAVGGNGNATDVAGVGDVVHFQLEGTLPSNYDLYLGGYQYTFIDTLSKGLGLSTKDGRLYDTGSADDFVNVTVKGLFTTKDNGSNWTWDPEAEKIIPITYTDYTSAVNEVGHTHHLTTSPTESYQSNKNYVASYNTEDRTLTVKFTCLKEIIIKDADADIYYRLGYNTKETEKSSEIYVDYYAKVNKDAVVDPGVGNENKAQIQYSDNPQAYGDTDYTTVNKARVYTFGLDIVKIDAAKFLENDGNVEGTEVKLAGAKFALVRKNPNFISVADTPDEKEYQIAKFSSVASTGEKTDPFVGAAYDSIDSWIGFKVDKDKDDPTPEELQKAIAAYLTENAGDGVVYEVTSDANGAINISGLDVDVTYTMVETATPDDIYAKINPFDITLIATKDDTGQEYDGTLKSATVTNTVGGTESFSYTHYVQLLDPIEDDPKNADDDGSANMLVANFKYVDLPSTGGIGIYPFYIIGGIVVAGSIILFALSRRKKTA